MHTYEDFKNIVNGTQKWRDPGGTIEYSQTGVGAYHERLRTGERRVKPSKLDPSPYNLFDRNVVQPRGVATVTALGYPEGTEHSGTHVGFSYNYIRQYAKLMDHEFDGNLSDEANIKALAKLNARDFDLGAAWAERGKTAQLIGDVATTAVDALRAIKRKDGRGLLGVLGLDQDGARGKGVVDAYLAYHYGMKPLLQDVAGATSALARNVRPEDWSVRSVGSARTEERWSSSQFINAGLGYSIKQQAFKGSRVIITAQQRAIDRHQDLMWATGLDNPLGSMYELIPFSFVADWMIPVGDWLEALNSLKYYKNFVTVRCQKYNSEIIASSARFVSGGARWDCHFRGSERIVSLMRQIVSGGLPITGLPVKNPVSVDHMAKALALLASKSANAAELPRYIRY